MQVFNNKPPLLSSLFPNLPHFRTPHCRLTLLFEAFSARIDTNIYIKETLHLIFYLLSSFYLYPSHFCVYVHVYATQMQFDKCQNFIFQLL